jgi:multifunctional methyltransferase subunit TRM112
MKLLTLNFLTCARKACKSSPLSFPLHPRSATLEIIETDLHPLFLRNLLPRLDWPALASLCTDLGLPGLVPQMPAPDELYLPAASAADATQTSDDGVERELETPVWTQESGVSEKSAEEVGEVERRPSQLARDLHRLLLETTVVEGKLVCGCCGHEYAVKEGIANFLLPPHLV